MNPASESDTDASTTEHEIRARPPSRAVVEAVAERDGRDGTELRPLGVVLDADALDALFASAAVDGTAAVAPDGTEESDRNPARISFSYAGYRVTVLSEGVVRLVAEPAD